MAINLFDPGFYRASNPDLASFNDAQAFQHFLEFGANEGRRFSPYLNLNFYRANNPDLAAAGLTTNRQLYDHLSGVGVAEGRNFSPVFNANFYRGANPDLAAAGLNNEQMFDHFRAFGLNEGRQAAANFQAGFYLTSNPDLAAAGFNFQQAVDHYILLGIGEGRIAAPGGGTINPPPPPPPPPPTGDPLPPANSTLSFASDLGALNGNLTLTDFVGTDDRNDYYRFTLPNHSNFGITLGALTDSAIVQLYKDYNLNGEVDSGDGEILAGDYGYSGRNANISRALGAGTYFMRVYPENSGDSTTYDLRLSVSPQPGNLPTDPGNRLATALDLGILGNNTFKDFAGTTDRNDYYRFTLNNNSDLTLTLAALTDGAQLQVIQDKNNNGQIDNADGEILEGDYGYSGRNANISTALAAGTYFMRVFTDNSDDNTTYELRVGVQPRTGPQNQNRMPKTDLLTNGGTVNQEFIAATDIVNGGLDDVNIPVVDNFTAPVAVGVGSELGDGFVADVFGTGAQSGDVFAANPLDANFTAYSTVI